ncbi:MAG: hypothetical protein ACREMY_27925, partial [bacterium]
AGMFLMSRRRPLALPEAVRYFHGAQRATAAVCARLQESGADVSVAEEMQQLSSGYRAALEETMLIPLAGDSEVECASDPLPVLAT